MENKISGWGNQTSHNFLLTMCKQISLAEIVTANITVRRLRTGMSALLSGTLYLFALKCKQISLAVYEQLLYRLPACTGKMPVRQSGTFYLSALSGKQIPESAILLPHKAGSGNPASGFSDFSSCNNGERTSKSVKWLYQRMACLFFLFSIFAALAQAQEEDLQLFSYWQFYSDAPNALYKGFCDTAFHYLDQRRQKIAQLHTAADWQQRQQNVKDVLMEIAGPFPEKTPLNAKVTDVLQKDGYRVEKLIYESLPGFYVTAGLFLPDNLRGKTPAILFCSGHTPLAFRSEAYQQMVLNLVKKGFIVLAFDPVGQGERQQYYDAEEEKSRFGPTHEHSYPGAQCFIAGNSVAKYMIWDGIRSIDYLLTRPEVDPQRIGVTGRSGGGTQTAYIAAFDERVTAAAPECYITTLEHQLKTGGPQDAEQNFYQGIAHGIDHADLLEVRAPKPTLMITTTRDIFSIEGARSTFNEAKKAYEAFGKAEHISMVEDDAPHASTPKNREAMYAFFQQHLSLPGDPSDEEVTLLTPEELQITGSGQVITSLNSKTVFDLNREESEKLIEQLNSQRQQLTLHLEAVKKAAKKLSGYIAPADTPSPIFSGRYQREGYAVEKYLLPVDERYAIPVLVMIPGNTSGKEAVLYLHPQGKAAEALPGGTMEKLVHQGYFVVAPDVRGIGELGPGYLEGDAYIQNVSYNQWFGGILTAKSIVALQAADVARVIQFISIQFQIKQENLTGMAQGALAPTLLHTAVLENTFAKIALIEPLVSYRSVVMHKLYEPSLIPSTVAGALTAYDLPDLAASLAPRKLLMIDVADQNGSPAGKELLAEDAAIIYEAYASHAAENNFVIDHWDTQQSMENAFINWLK